MMGKAFSGGSDKSHRHHAIMQCLVHAMAYPKRLLPIIGMDLIFKLFPETRLFLGKLDRERCLRRFSSTEARSKFGEFQTSDVYLLVQIIYI